MTHAHIRWTGTRASEDNWQRSTRSAHRPHQIRIEKVTQMIPIPSKQMMSLAFWRVREQKRGEKHAAFDFDSRGEWPGGEGRDRVAL